MTMLAGLKVLITCSTPPLVNTLIVLADDKTKEVEALTRHLNPAIVRLPAVVQAKRADLNQGLIGPLRHDDAALGVLGRLVERAFVGLFPAGDDNLDLAGSESSSKREPPEQTCELVRTFLVKYPKIGVLREKRNSKE